MKLISHLFDGDVLGAIEWINRYDLAEYVIYLDAGSYDTAIILRLPKDFDVAQLGRLS